MTDFEKQMMKQIDSEYQELVEAYDNVLALYTANLIMYYGMAEKKTFQYIMQLIAASSQILSVPMGKVVAKTGMPKEKAVKIETASETISVNKDYITEKGDIESIRKMLIGIHASIFLRHVKAVVESEEGVVKEYAEKMGWRKEWKQPVDKRENPRAFFQQNYIKSAVAYGIMVSENSLQKAGEAICVMQENVNRGTKNE